MEGDFQEIEHTADLAMRVRGRTLADLFVNAATGLYDLVTDLRQMQAAVERAVEVTGLDVEALLVNWLNELLYMTEVDGLMFGQFEIVELGPGRLRAVARGQVGAPLRKYVKAATFHDLHIRQVGDGYETTIVLDT